jgi:hypothetical protein
VAANSKEIIAGLQRYADAACVLPLGAAPLSESPSKEQDASAAAKKTASNRSMLPPPKASINEARTLMLFALLIRAGPCRRQRQPCLSDSEVMAVARVLAEVLHNNIPRP